MSTYLEEAAAELRNARRSNDERTIEARQMHGGLEQDRRLILKEVNARRLELADGFIRLAAIEAGLPTYCCHPARPEESQP